MPLETLHPDESALHHALRDALNQRLTSRFFCLDQRRANRGRDTFVDLDGLVTETERWLATRDPDR
jgi:hypothetical protein